MKNPWEIYFSARVNSLISESRAINKAFAHNGLRGHIRELFVKELLEPFLPPHIGIGTGEIINHLGGRSRQVDVVLYDKARVPPILVQRNGPGLFPWECVICIVEVKSTITSQAVEEAHLNADSIRSVYADLKNSDSLIGGKMESYHTPASPPVQYFVFGFESDLKSSKETKEIRSGSRNHSVGQEGFRLFSSFDRLGRKRAPKDADQEPAVASHEPSVEGRLLYNSINGICVADREWSHTPIKFGVQKSGRYDSEPFGYAELTHFHWGSIFNNGGNQAASGFLSHLINLSVEIPKCRTQYQIARYLMNI